MLAMREPLSPKATFTASIVEIVSRARGIPCIVRC